MAAKLQSDIEGSACRRIAFGDGVGFGAISASDFVESLPDPDGIDLLLGWIPEGQFRVNVDRIRHIRTVMGGYALRGPIDMGVVRYVPTRLGNVPALLNGSLRRDTLIASVSASPDGYLLTTESGWQRAAIDAGANVLGIERNGVPVLDAGPPIARSRVRIIDSCIDPPAVVAWGEPSDVHREIGGIVATLIPEGARVQYGPGPVGTAVLDALQVPVYIDSGMVTDAVMRLDGRGLLLSKAFCAYLGGSELLYEWAPGRVTVDRVEVTHNPVRLAADPPLIAVNTALEIDHDGQVNVETVGGSAVAGIGGHPDYAFSAAQSLSGLSVIAVPTHRGSHRTLVDQLSAPTSTPSHDTDLVVTEYGTADLRGLDRHERRKSIAALWP